MSKKYKCLVSGYCPHLQKNHTIPIVYEEIGMCGNPIPDYKKMECSCEYHHECTALDEYGRCWVLVKAPDHPPR